MITTDNPMFFGAASEVITPFTENGHVEFGLLKNEIEFMVEKGVTGFFVNGLASEALMMNENDRQAVAMEVRKVTLGKVPVMGNILANSTDEGVKIARKYQDMGMNAIIITPPVVYKYTNEGLINFFNEISESVEIPTFIYNAPETGNKLDPEIVAKLFNHNPRFLGYKDSTQNTIDLLTLLNSLDNGRHFELMSGSDALITPIMMLGGIGVISLITVVFPELIVETCKACIEADWQLAMELQNRVLHIRQALKVGPFMAAYKYASQLVGNPLGVVKKPLVDLNQKEKEIIRGKLSAEGLV